MRPLPLFPLLTQHALRADVDKVMGDVECFSHVTSYIRVKSLKIKTPNEGREMREISYLVEQILCHRNSSVSREFPAAFALLQHRWVSFWV